MTVYEESIMNERAMLKQQLRQRAAEMVPVLRERANACEESRQVPAETIADMQEAGFFKILQPKKVGRLRAGPAGFLRCSDDGCRRLHVNRLGIGRCGDSQLAAGFV